MVERFQRWFWAMFLGIFLLSLAGCQASTLNSQKVIQLTLWQGINPPPNRDIFDNLVRSFNETHPDIQVESLYVGQADQQLPKILTAVVGNSSPDILWFGPFFTGQLAELGAIKPLEDWFNALPQKADIDPALLESMTLDGHIWSVPMGTNNLALFYRPSLFKEAGLTKLPQTWEEVRQAAKQLTKDTNGDGRPDQHGILLSLGKGEWTVFNWLPFMYSAGGELIQGKNINLANEGAVSALEFWTDLLKDGSAILSAPERGYEQDNFINGKVAMQLTGPWTLGYLAQTKIDFDVLPLPVAKKPATVIGGENLFVMKTTPEREQAALKFLEYVIGIDFQTQFALGTGYLPVNLKARQSQNYQEFISKQPSLKVFIEQMKYARSRPIRTGYARISDTLGRAIEASLLGKEPKQALESAQTRLNLNLATD
ncbi:ABC transporter substrate-binding protein [Ancylothrix sp. C2]|uniref:ABC transporter substrate-binding protein n=1 Tax=Ancylothrix sp. D3o TaxID=2953691 RepID=UPI0021BB9B07|nr:ABC transporter substrate-binding protein [Ancylothrix sp. D3o]MCT7949841.1 ABC transporter substrate-binding protein [Ancylothrix sp. D3o]